MDKNKSHNQLLEKVINDLEYVVNKVTSGMDDGMDLDTSIRNISSNITHTKELLKSIINNHQICTTYTYYHMYGFDGNILSNNKTLAPDINIYAKDVDSLFDQFFNKERCIKSISEYPIEIEIYKEVRMELPSNQQIQVRLIPNSLQHEYNTNSLYTRVKDIILDRNIVYNREETKKMIFEHPKYDVILNARNKKLLKDIKDREIERQRHQKIKNKNDFLMWESLNKTYGNMSPEELNKLKQKM